MSEGGNRIQTMITVALNDIDAKEALLQQLIKEPLVQIVTKSIQGAWKDTYAVERAIRESVTKILNEYIKEILETKYKEQVKQEVERFLQEEYIVKMAERVTLDYIRHLKER